MEQKETVNMLDERLPRGACSVTQHPLVAFLWVYIRSAYIIILCYLHSNYIS